MSLRTLTQLRTASRRRSDTEDDGNFVSDEELNEYVNESIAELYDVMIEGDSRALFSVNAPVLTQVGTNSYRLPSDFYRLVSVNFRTSARYLVGKPGEILNLADMALNPPSENNYQYFIRFNLATGDRFLFIYPEINEANLAIVYLPEAPVLSIDTDTFYGPNQWHEYIAISAGIKILTKQEKDTTSLEIQRRNLEKRIRSHISKIDIGVPTIVREIEHLFNRRGFDASLPPP